MLSSKCLQNSGASNEPLGHNVGNQMLRLRKLIEVTLSPPQQCLFDGVLQRVLPRLDGTLLVRLPAVVAARSHAVVAAQVVVAPRQFLFFGQVVECRRETVGAMFFRHTAKSPLGILQSLRQGRETLAATYDFGMPPT